MEFPDYDNFELDTTVILDTLTSESPALTREQNEQLFNAVMEDYADVPLKSERMKHIREDSYYNALQVKFGYAVTCHKAQGGQWTDVYIDQGYMTDEMVDAGLPPLALYGFHPCHRSSLSGQLAGQTNSLKGMILCADYTLLIPNLFKS